MFLRVIERQQEASRIKLVNYGDSSRLLKTVLIKAETVVTVVTYFKQNFSTFNPKCLYEIIFSNIIGFL